MFLFVNEEPVIISDNDSGWALFLGTSSEQKAQSPCVVEMQFAFGAVKCWISQEQVSEKSSSTVVCRVLSYLVAESILLPCSAAFSCVTFA